MHINKYGKSLFCTTAIGGLVFELSILLQIVTLSNIFTIMGFDFIE